MKSKLVVLMLALLCVACAGKSSKQDETKEKMSKVSIVLELDGCDVLKKLAPNATDEDLKNIYYCIKRYRELKCLEQEHSACDPVCFSDLCYPVTGGKPLAYYFSSPDSKIDYKMFDREVVEILEAEIETATETSLKILLQRLTSAGTAQPMIYRMVGYDYIKIEVPAADISEARRINDIFRVLSNDGKLEFWPTYSAQSGNARNNANVVLAKMQAADKAVQKYLESDPTTRANPSLLQVLDIAYIGGGVIGVAETEEQQNVVNEYLALPEVSEIFGDNVLFMWSSKPSKDYNNMFLLYAIYDEDADGKAPLDGSVVKEARANYSQYGSDAEVSMTMNGDGARKWANITEANQGMNIAIVLDGCVYSAPVVNDKITGGNSSISGDFTIQEAQDLANILKSGEMPMSASILQTYWLEHIEM